MPRYDYICQDCLHPFEIEASITAYSRGLDVKCPKCGSPKVNGPSSG